MPQPIQSQINAMSGRSPNNAARMVRILSGPHEGREGVVDRVEGGLLYVLAPALLPGWPFPDVLVLAPGQVEACE